MAAPIYADGKPRPRWRGVVHRFVARWLCYGCAMLYAWLLVQLDVAGAGRRWLLLLMGLGKLASYGASAQLHHGQFSQLEALTGALRVDLGHDGLNEWLEGGGRRREQEGRKGF